MFELITISIIPVIISFLSTYFLIKKWIPIAHKLGFVGKDMNKYGDIKVAEIGGFYVILGIIFSLLIYVALKVYVLKTIQNLVEIFAVITLLSLSAILGLLDDVLGWKKGLGRKTRIITPIILSLPLVIIGVGKNYSLNLPIIGEIYLGILYPLLIIPIAITGTSNGFNMLEGYNGLGATLALILFGSLSIKTYLIGAYYLSYISILTASSILAFLIFNKYPAKVFPGNTFTYGIGALFGAIVVLGSLEKFGLILFIPYFIELFLFIRGLINGVYKENFGIPDENNNLREPYEKIYSLTHFAIRINKKIFGRCKEYMVVYTIALIQLFFAILAFIV